MAQVNALKACLDSFRPLAPEQVKNLADAMRVLNTYESTHIEGNTLTLQETTLVIEKGLTIAGKPLREHLEVSNHAHALDYIQQLVDEGQDFNDWTLRNIHQLVLAGIDRKNAGQYRTVQVAIVGSQHEPPEPHRLLDEMQAYFASYETQKSQLHPVILAAELHDRLVAVHPFVDGNGRTARLVMNLILLQHGYVIANISAQAIQREAYYHALETSHLTGDTAPFHMFVLNAVRETFFWYLRKVAASYDETRGGHFFQRIQPYLEK